MQFLGKEVSPEALCVELLKDRAFFEKSGGGVTLSGGEPTLQPAFAIALCQHLHAAGVQVAVDTCGLCAWETLRSFIPYTAVFLYDLKFIDEGEHRRWTGAPNQGILDNLKQLGAEVAAGKRRLWIRTPLIPRATLSQKNISAIGAWLGKEMDGRVERWELCAFNNLCRDKYRRLDLDWEFASAQTLSTDQVLDAHRWAVSSGVNPDLVSTTGAVKK